MKIKYVRSLVKKSISSQGIPRGSGCCSKEDPSALHVAGVQREPARLCAGEMGAGRKLLVENYFTVKKAIV